MVAERSNACKGNQVIRGKIAAHARYQFSFRVIASTLLARECYVSMVISSSITAALDYAISHGASDVILREGQIPVVRINGELFSCELVSLTADDMESLWKACHAVSDTLDHDASLAMSHGERFRVNLHRRLGERGAVLRRIKQEIPSFDALGVPADLLREWGQRHSGILIVTGPTGSGKSTTLAAFLEHINQTAARHIVTIEDPVEYLFTPALSIFTQREVGVDTPTFAEGLRRSLRQNPDIILLGEIRDALSAVSALQAAETGHLVLATLHASSCSEAVERLEMLFPQSERDAVRKVLAAQLAGVLYQRLVPLKTGGRIAACEYFSNEALTRKLIAEGRLSELQEFVSRGDQRTAQSFQDALLQLVRDDKVDEAVAVEMVPRPQEFQRILKGVVSGAQSARR